MCVCVVHCLYSFIGSRCNDGVLIVLFVYIPHSSLKPGIFHSIFLGMAIFGHFTNRLTGNSSDRLTGQSRRKKQFET